KSCQGIVEVLANNNRLERCVSIYAEARIENARAAFKAINVEYLEIQLSETVSVQTVESYIDQWDEHMEFAVRHLLHKEHKLCNEVYCNIESEDVKLSCFAKITNSMWIYGYFLISEPKSCKCKKEAIKLLSLLKIFSTLDKLRFQFNDMFDGKFCVEIRNRTRDLLKNIVDGTCEIFCELSVQVELQRAFSPPPNGDVPRLVCFVAEYCNRLLKDENKSILVRVLEIYNSNNKVEFEDGLLSFKIHNVMKALEINLETWSTSYKDNALSYFFTMNSHWYLFNNVRGTQLGDLMGDSSLWAYYESVDYYADLYMRESWGKITVLLREEGLILFPGGRAVDRNLAKKRIRLFCEAFDDAYKKQSKWGIV
ncbi:exocyst complex component exo70a1, partial [Phtheirospermum japonicum]